MKRERIFALAIIGLMITSVFASPAVAVDHDIRIFDKIKTSLSELMKALFNKLLEKLEKWFIELEDETHQEREDKTESKNESKDFVLVGTEEAKELIEDNPSIVVVDIRPWEDYSKEHIEGAISIPYTGCPSCFVERMEPFRNETILLYCKSGKTSRIVCRVLVENGFSVYNLDGGLKGWKEKGYPTEKASEDSKPGSSTGVKRKLGLIPAPLPKPRVEVTLGAELPSKFDWRDYNGVDWTTPVKDQGACGCCYAFASLAAVETIIKLSMDDPNYQVDLSEQYMVSCGEEWYGDLNGDGEDDMDGCDGATLEATAIFIVNEGVLSEGCFPYKAKLKSCSERCSDEPEYPVTDWIHISDKRDSIKSALLKYGPLFTGMEVYEDFYWYTGGVYRHSEGEYEGHHAVTIVGYDDENGCWICKNSWGTGWGENGWFRIAYGQCGIEEDVIAFVEKLDVDAGGPYYGYVDRPVYFAGYVSGGVPPYTWKWDFGDGTTSSEQDPTHTYSEPGLYIVKLTVKDGRGDRGWSTAIVKVDREVPAGVQLFFCLHKLKKIDEVDVWPDDPAPEWFGTVTVKGEKTGKLVWNWDCPKGEEVTPDLLYSFAIKDREVDVWIKVMDEDIFGFHDHLDVSGCPENKTFHCKYHVEDGVKKVGDHTIETRDDYLYTSGELPPDSSKDEDEDDVAVWFDMIHFNRLYTFDVQISIMGDRICVEPGEDVYFQAIVKGGVPPYRYYWEFGDGETSTEKDPVHRYTSAGRFTVRLTVTDYWDQSREAKYVIKVTRPPYKPREPHPKNGDTYVGRKGVVLSWTGGDPDGDKVYYDVYFGTDPNPPIYRRGLTSTQCEIRETLKGKTWYYWKVVARDEYGAVTEGDVWKFQTRKSTSSSGGESEANAGLPKVEAIDPEILDDDTVILRGILLDDGGESCECYFEIWINGSYYDVAFAGIHRSGETFSYTVYGLEAGEIYNWRAYAINSAGRSYSETRTLATRTSRSNNI